MTFSSIWMVPNIELKKSMKNQDFVSFLKIFVEAFRYVGATVLECDFGGEKSPLFTFSSKREVPDILILLTPISCCI